MIVSIIQARLNSSRLNGKVLLPLPTGRTVLAEVVYRVSRSKLVDKTLIVTPDRELVQDFGAEIVWKNCSRDVLAEYYWATPPEATQIVRITSDCPLIEPDIIDEVIKWHLRSGADYTYNRCDGNGGGDGLDVEVFTREALVRAHKEAYDRFDREHVTPYFRKGKFYVMKIPAPDFEGCSLDTQEDYELICKILGDKK